ncbi:hypothetical protein [Teredinibacter sp. KSP-S5-2]|uniref:anti-sigma factor family protein n=1 Tax=Teredinibacter sp. KSP-S5-2 TaxID=3034506 RepID=UPI002934ABE4|nr:hypothetical protein [Teredinibacter sp. KSP-S5-2]WNO08807.1 hypothetical protein P5V12_17690 [Teredinibacter sp. KSP-S5-2]
MIDDELLSAYLDGELSEHEEAQLQKRLVADQLLRERLQELSIIDVYVNRAFDDINDQPVPDSLTQLMTTPFISERLVRFVPTIIAQQPVRALAASVLVGLMVGISYLNIFSSVDSPSDQIADIRSWIEGDTLGGLLEQTSSNQTVSFEQGASFHAVLSYISKDGRPCREFKLSKQGKTGHGVACRFEQEQWQDELFIVEAVAVPTDGYTPASGQAVSIVDAYIDNDIRSIALNAAEEKTLIDNQWQMN